MRTLAEARVSEARVSAKAALASFFCESLRARFWASTERVEREAVRASEGAGRRSVRLDSYRGRRAGKEMQGSTFRIKPFVHVCMILL